MGITGFCMGGVLTLLALANVPEADAGVAWYGLPSFEHLDAGKIRVPLMAHWATQDAAFAIDTVDFLENKFRAAKLDYTGHHYLAYHAFANEGAAFRSPSTTLPGRRWPGTAPWASSAAISADPPLCSASICRAAASSTSPSS